MICYNSRRNSDLDSRNNQFVSHAITSTRGAYTETSPLITSESHHIFIINLQLMQQCDWPCALSSNSVVSSGDVLLAGHAKISRSAGVLPYYAFRP